MMQTNSNSTMVYKGVWALAWTVAVLTVNAADRIWDGNGGVGDANWSTENN